MVMSPTTTQARPGAILSVILASYLMIAVDMSIVNIALPSIRASLGFSAVTLSWVVNAYLIVYGGLLLLGGRSGDIAGRKRILFTGIALFTAASALGGMAPSAFWLLAARAVQGVGAAMVAPSTMALIVSNFAEGPARNRALSLYSTAISFGVVIGLLLGGLLTDLLSWRWVFYVNVPIGVALLFAIPRLLRETEKARGRVDISGGIASTLGVSSMVFALIDAAASGLGSAWAVAGFATAMLVLAFFVFHERRTEHPLLPLSLLANRNRVAAYLCLLLVIAGNFGMFFFVTQFLQGVLRLTPAQTGFAFLPMAVTVMLTVRIVPTLLKRFQPKVLILAGTAMQGVAMLALSRLSGGTDYASGILGPMILVGLATGLCSIPLTATALSGIERHESGAASGMTQTMISVGGSTGLAVLVTVFGMATGSVSAAGFAAAFVHGTSVALRAAVIFAGIAFTTALVLIRSPRRAQRAAGVTDEERNKRVVRRYFEMVSSGDAAGAREMLHPEWVDHAHIERSDGAADTGPVAEKQDAVHRLRVVIDRMLSEGDHVAVRSTIHRLIDGRPLVSRAMWFIRMEGGKMVEMWTAHEPDMGAGDLGGRDIELPELTPAE